MYRGRTKCRPDLGVWGVRGAKPANQEGAGSSLGSLGSLGSMVSSVTGSSMMSGSSIVASMAPARIASRKVCMSLVRAWLESVTLISSRRSVNAATSVTLPSNSRARSRWAGCMSGSIACAVSRSSTKALKAGGVAYALASAANLSASTCMAIAGCFASRWPSWLCMIGLLCVSYAARYAPAFVSPRARAWANFCCL